MGMFFFFEYFVFLLGIHMDCNGFESKCKLAFDDKLSEKKRRNCVQFTITAIDSRLLNALRGILLEEIPCLAFHTIRFDENKTVLKHEQVMETLRMLAISSEAVDELQWSKDCHCISKPCEACSVEFTLHVENTSTTSYRSVTTNDLILAQRTQTLREKVELLHAGDDCMEIVLLGPGQTIRLTAYAQVGIGRDHGKWVCVPTMNFQGLPELDTIYRKSRELSQQAQRKIQQSCPRNVLVMKSEGIDIEDVRLCTACDECLLTYNALTTTNHIKPQIKLSETDFLVTIETDGRFTVQNALQRAFSILSKKVCIHK